MKKRRRRHNGWLIAEMLIVIAIIGLMMTALVGMGHLYGRFNKMQFARQKCLHAARAQLDSFTATGRGLDEQEFDRLWPEMECTIDRTPGRGDFAGTQLVRVTVTTTLFERRIETELSRYIAEDRPK